MLIAGDFNFTPDSAPYQELSRWARDSFSPAPRAAGRDDARGGPSL